MTKKLRFVDIGGCGGSIYRSQRQADAVMELRYSITPIYRDNSAMLSISTLKKGTVSVYESFIIVELESVDKAKEIAQKFNDIINNSTLTPEEQTAYNEYLKFKQEQQDTRFAEAIKILTPYAGEEMIEAIGKSPTVGQTTKVQYSIELLKQIVELGF